MILIWKLEAPRKDHRFIAACLPGRKVRLFESIPRISMDGAKAVKSRYYLMFRIRAIITSWPKLPIPLLFSKI